MKICKYNKYSANFQSYETPKIKQMREIPDLHKANGVS